MLSGYYLRVKSFLGVSGTWHLLLLVFFNGERNGGAGEVSSHRWGSGFFVVLLSTPLGFVTLHSPGPIPFDSGWS